MNKLIIRPTQLILLSFGLSSILKHISLFISEFTIYEHGTDRKYECLEG